MSAIRNLFMTPVRRMSGRHLIKKRTTFGSFATVDEYEQSRQDKREKVMAKRKRNNQTFDVIAQKTEPRNYEKLPTDFRELQYDKLGQDPANKFAKVMNNLRTTRYRNNHGVCLLHGKGLIKEAMKSGCFIRSIYFSQLEQLWDFPMEILSKTKLINISQDVLNKYAEKRVEGVYALITQQDKKTRQKIIDSRENNKEVKFLPITVVCTGITDASVLGNILRTASATGCQQVFTMEGCVDIWNMEVLKSARAAHFKIPVESDLNWEDLDSRANAHRPARIFLSQENLADPLSLKDFVENPKFQKIQNQNRMIQTLKQESNVEVFKDEIDFSAASIAPLPYYETNFSTKSNYVIIGNIDLALFKFAAKMQFQGSDCSVVNLPVAQQSDKAGIVTLSNVLLFEARKQLLSNRE